MDDKNVIASVEKPHEIECINKAVITGSVIHKYRPRPDIIVLTVAVKEKEINEVDYPNVAFFGESIAESIDKNITIEGRNYPRVRIDGQVRTSRKETSAGIRYFQNIIGTRIARTQTNMETISGIRNIGSHKVPSENDVCILGRISSIYPISKSGRDTPIGYIVTARVQTDGHVNYPRITCFGAIANKVRGLERGDVICATGFIETANRERDGKLVKFESFIATEVEKITDEK